MSANIREKLIEEFYYYGPPGCEDIDRSKLEAMPLEELIKDVDFFKATYGWD